MVLHKESNYDYYFIIRELVEGYKGQFKCLEENTEKHLTLLVPMKKEKT